MNKQRLAQEDIIHYRQHLLEEERSPATIEKYVRDIKRFYCALPENKKISKEAVIDFKLELSSRFAVTSVNSMLVAVNGFLKFIGRSDCCVKQLKSQRSFCAGEKELTREEYYRLLEAAKQKGEERILLVMQTICSTGIRVGELQFITIEGVQGGNIRVASKGKERFVMIPKELKKLLLQYCKRNQINSGCIFITKSGVPLNRSNIWADMKRLCEAANVAPQKVFPHNLRHLFALTFYQMKKDLVHLADILGHSNVETTRIYTTISSHEHREMLSKMRLVIKST